MDRSDRLRRRGGLATASVWVGAACVVAGAVLGVAALRAAPPAPDPAASRPQPTHRGAERVEGLGGAVAVAQHEEPGASLRRGRAPVTGTSGARRSPDRPLRLFALGDSVAQTLGPSFLGAADQLRARGVDAEVTRMILQPGFGITADLPGVMVWDGADPSVEVPPPAWFATWALQVGAAIEADQPDVVIVLSGAWDAIPRSVDGVWLTPGTPEWERWYAARVARANDLFGATGAHVVWLRYPCIESAVQTERVAAVSDVLERVARRDPGVTVLPFDDVVCPGGTYSREVPLADGTPVTIRLADGTHFEYFGAPFVVSPWLAEALLELVGAHR